VNKIRVKNNTDTQFKCHSTSNTSICRIEYMDCRAKLFLTLEFQEGLQGPVWTLPVVTRCKVDDKSPCRYKFYIYRCL